MTIKNICSGSIIPVHYEYIKLFVEKTGDYKTGISEAVVWAYIIQNSWKDGVLPDVVSVNIQSIKDIFAVSNQFVDSMFDTLKSCGILSFFERTNACEIKFSLVGDNGISIEQDSLKIKVKSNNKIEYTKEFLHMWSLYPKRNKPSPKKPAFIVWQARIKDGFTSDQLIAAVKNYFKYCEDEGNINTSFVLMPQTFFGSNERYEPYLEDESQANMPVVDTFLKNHSTEIIVDRKTMSGVVIKNDTSKSNKRKRFMENFNKK